MRGINNIDKFHSYLTSNFDDLNIQENNHFNPNCEICKIENLNLTKCQNSTSDLSILHLNHCEHPEPTCKT